MSEYPSKREGVIKNKRSFIMANKIINRETPLMHQAFEFYYNLGQERNCGRVAGEFHKFMRTVEMWSNSFNWVDRVAERDK